jgi:hypothetical protein
MGDVGEEQCDKHATADRSENNQSSESFDLPLLETIFTLGDAFGGEKRLTAK